MGHHVCIIKYNKWEVQKEGMKPRLIITRANGKCAVDTNTEEDASIMITVMPAMKDSNFTTVGTLNAALEKYFKGSGPGSKYLDKEAVIKALKGRYEAEPPYTFAEFIEQFEQGKFDAQPLLTDEAVQSCYRKTLSDKDAEITRLKGEFKDTKMWLDAAQSSYTQEIGVNRDKTKKIHELKNRITDLEKLCDMQKATIDTQGKALREAREQICKTCEGKGFITEYTTNGSASSTCPVCKGTGLLAQKAPEPELFICPTHQYEECDGGYCLHAIPHKRINSCDGGTICKQPCIPIKSQIPQPSSVPTSGTGTAPEGEDNEPDLSTISNCIKKEPIVITPEICTKFWNYRADSGHLYHLLYDLIGEEFVTSHDLMDSIMKVLDEWEDMKEQTYPGMAKDIGDLTLRVDNLESFREKQEDNNKDHAALLRRIQFNHHCLALHMKRVETLETALKALQEEVKAIPHKEKCLK